MKKGYKFSMAVALTAAIIVPVVAANAATSYDIDEVVIVQSGQEVSISKSLYQAALTEGFIKSADIEYIHSTNGKYYKKSIFQAAIAEAGSIIGALDFLNSSTYSMNISPVEGEFSGTGQLVPVDPIANNFKVLSID